MPKSFSELKVGMEVKTLKIHPTKVMGIGVEYQNLPEIELPDRIHGIISYVSPNPVGSDEFHVKWTELHVETIENWNGFTIEHLEVTEE